MKEVFDLEERLLAFSAMVVILVEKLPNNRTGNHIAGQLLRSGTSPLSNHGEAESAESAKDFIHKISLCLKELRESFRWLRLIRRLNLSSEDKVIALMNENDQLIRIFNKSLQTAKSRINNVKKR